MKHVYPFLAALLLAGVPQAQAQVTNPIVTSWLLNTTGVTGFGGLTANVASVKYSTSSVYVACSGIPSYSRTYVAMSNTSRSTNSWFPQPTAGPKAVTYTAYRYRLPLTPTPNTGTPVSIPGGTIGVWINGTNMHPAKDAASYKTSTGTVVNNGDAVWFTDAVVNEGIGFDDCNGHPDISDIYHTHVNPDCLYDRRDSTSHSPIIGWAMDGYPVYGAYGYKVATDPNSGLKSMKSSYRLRSITQRHSLSDGVALPASKYGPDVNTSFPLGKFVEDNEYVAGRGDLDARNGRWCVTPEYPNGTYAYFATINSFYEGAYPYTIAGTYYGTVPYANTTSTTASINESVTTYTPGTALTVSTPTVLGGGSFASVTVTGTGKLLLVEPLTVSTALAVQSGGALDVGTLDANTPTIGGAGSVAVAAGARLSLDNTAGLTSTGAIGAVQVTGTRSFDAGAEYVYAGSAAQVTGAGLPASVHKLTVNNSAGLTLSQSTTITGTLTLQNGALNTASGQQLTISSGGTLAAGSTNKVAGPGQFTLSSGATLQTGHTAGITSSGNTGSVQTGGTRSYHAGASYEYNGTAAQATGSGLPATVANLTINNSAGVTLTNSVAATANITLSAGKLSTASGKHLSVNAGATFTAGTNTVDGAGNVTLASGAALKTAHPAGLSSSGASGTLQNTGTRSLHAGASYVYNGTAAQTTGSGLPAAVANLTINNANGVSLTNDVTTNTSLTMTSGVLTTGGQRVTLGSTATLSESEASYVTGTVQTTRDLTVAGATSDFGGIGLALKPIGNTLPGITTATRVTGTAQTGVNGGSSINRYFDIAAATSSGLDVTLTMSYRDAELNSLPEATLGLYKSTNGTAGPWAAPTTGTLTRDAAANTVQLTGVTGFSTWTLGTAAANPLPVELVGFTAARRGADALLRWTTAQELRNDYFEVQASSDGRIFERLGRVNGHGNSSQAHHYEFVDETLGSRPAGVVYYRLRQVDTDGAGAFSPVQSLITGRGPAAGLILAAVPNPLPPGEQPMLQVAAPGAGAATLTVCDPVGRVLIRQPLTVPAGTSRVALPVSAAPLRAGLYHVRLEMGAARTSAKLVVE